MRIHVPILPLALVVLLPLAGCGDRGQQDTPGDSLVTRGIKAAIERADKRLEDQNISIGGKNRNGIQFGNDTGNLPHAEITPQGDLLIEGKAVAIDPNQRRLLLEHRRQVISIARAGLAAGARGAGLGVTAATGALKAVATGSTEEFEARMEAEGDRLEAEVMAGVCSALPGLLASQRALARALPEFRPYATLDEQDVATCGKDGDGSRKLEVTANLSGDLDPAAGEMDAAAEADAAARGTSSRQ